MAELKNLSEIFKNKELLKKFRVFLRGHLALENLLFYESILLYEKTDCPVKRGEAAIFMVTQFVKADGLDAANISYATREELEAVTEFNRNSFHRAKVELYRLMDSNFFDSFRQYIDGHKTKLVENFDSLSSTYMQDLSVDSVEELIEEDDEGHLHFLACSCEKGKQEKEKMNLVTALHNLREVHLPKFKRPSLGLIKVRALPMQKKKRSSHVGSKGALKSYESDAGCLKQL